MSLWNIINHPPEKEIRENNDKAAQGTRIC